MGISGKVARKLKEVYRSNKTKKQKVKYEKLLGKMADTPGGIPWYDSPGGKVRSTPGTKVRELASTAKQKGRRVLSNLNTKKKQVLSTLGKTKKQMLSPLKPAPRVLGRKVQMVAWDAKRAPPKGFVPPIINTTKTYRPK